MSYDSSTTGFLSGWTHRSGVTVRKLRGALLRQQIREAALPPGAPLPSQSQLMKQYGASSLTVQKAMSLLREEGWAVSRPGKGAFVSQKKDTEDAFRTVATALEQQIRTGMLAPGSPLPSRETLAGQFSTSLTVIDTALTLLANQQWLTQDETGRSLDVHVQRADHTQMATLLAQIAELRERVESLEADGKTREVRGRTG